VTFPTDAYGDLPEDRQDVFWTIPGADYFDNAAEERIAQDLYAVGFGYTAAEYDQMGLDPDQVHAAREDFFNFMLLEWDDFPWDEWREAMGYND
jgi:hypothetical protein